MYPSDISDKTENNQVATPDEVDVSEAPEML